MANCPHYGLIQPALDVLTQLGKMLPSGWTINLIVCEHGAVSPSAHKSGYFGPHGHVYMEDLPVEDGTPYPTPDLIRLVRHVRKLEGLDE